MSKTALSKEREVAIRDFSDQEVHFNYPASMEDFYYLIDLIENFMQIKSDYLNSELGEDMVIDCLIIMDVVSGLADKSDNFSNFLAVSRKYGFSCFYVFHTIYLNRQNWEMIMSQTNIFNFFPGSTQQKNTQNSFSFQILKTISLFASRYKSSYVPTSNVWLSKLYFHISTSKLKQYLTVDTRTINDLGPGKFRMQADNNLKQVCYYNRNKSDTSFNSFLAVRKQKSQKGEIKFSINKIITSLNNSDVTYLNIKSELKNIDNDNFQTKLQQIGRGDITRESPDKNRTRDRNERGKRQGTEHKRVSKKPRFLSG